MDGDLVIGLVLGFAGLIVSLVVVLWYFSDRVGDKMKDVEVGLSNKFDVLIEKVSTLTSDISTIKELVKIQMHQTIDIYLSKSNIRGRLSPRVEEFTSESASYLLSFDGAVPPSIIVLTVSKLDNPKFIVTTNIGTAIRFLIRTRDIDENTKIIKSFLGILDDEASKDRSREWADNVEKKLEEMLPK